MAIQSHTLLSKRCEMLGAQGIAGGTIDIQKINIASALVGRRFDQRK